MERQDFASPIAMWSPSRKRLGAFDVATFIESGSVAAAKIDQPTFTDILQMNEGVSPRSLGDASTIMFSIPLSKRTSADRIAFAIGSPAQTAPSSDELTLCSLSISLDEGKSPLPAFSALHFRSVVGPLPHSALLDRSRSFENSTERAQNARGTVSCGSVERSASP